MEDFIVNAKCVYTAIDIENDDYYLHVVTTVKQANYKAGDQSVIFCPSDGVINVELEIVKDVSIPDIYIETPVVHIVSIGTIQPLVYQQVNISVVLLAADGSSNNVGGAVLTSSAAVEDSRPVEVEDD